MTNEFWKKALEQARSERNEIAETWNELNKQREQFERRIIQLEETIQSLSVLVGEDRQAVPFEPVNLDNLPKLKLAEACREALRMSDNYMTPINVRDLLTTAKYDFSEYPNPLASIHAVVKRLADSGDVLKATDSKDNAVYKWNTSEFKHSPLKWVNQRLRQSPTAEPDPAKPMARPTTRFKPRTKKKS